jgi:hypothetical protein
MNDLQKEITDVDIELLHSLQSTSHHSISNKIDECVNKHGVEYTAKLIVFARDNNLTSVYCMVAAVSLIKYLNKSEFSKYFFTRRIGNSGGIIKDIRDITIIVNMYLLSEKTKRNVTEITNIPYPNSMRKGIKSALENFKWDEFIKYYEINPEFKINLKDIIKYFHPNPQKSIATFKLSLDTYINHFNDTNRYSKEIQKAKDEAKNGEYEIDIFHAILYDFVKNDDSKPEVKLQSEIDFVKTSLLDLSNIDEIRKKIHKINLKPNSF